MPFGAPGGDLQPQAMLQVFLNHTVFGMSIQEAVEAPRFVTHSFPGSFEPHPYYPGRLDLERPIGEATGEALSARGHRVEWLPELSIGTAGVCAISADLERGDPLRRRGPAPGGAGDGLVSEETSMTTTTTAPTATAHPLDPLERRARSSAPGRSCGPSGRPARDAG